ncbi:hypothetical protein [Aquimarina sediminis]|uniref:hypothetical protein n=1 Tax=Aquimarina sediminis TaxID=2070536 RepID=UPI000CA04492|nr:hypothetical protein [Aquimarina sediminis]
MKYEKGQKVIYAKGNENNYKAIILHRKWDFPKDYIDTPFAHGNFDYLIKVNWGNKEEDIFVMESDLL